MSKNKQEELEKTIIAIPENLSFEDGLNALEKVVDNLERGDITLEEAINSYEYGILLKNHCQTLLDNYKMKVEKIVKQSNQSVERENFTEEE